MSESIDPAVYRPLSDDELDERIAETEAALVALALERGRRQGGDLAYQLEVHNPAPVG